VPLEAFSEVHGAPMQRFYNLLCMAYGADRETFADLVTNGYLPQARARNCRVEFGEANFAFQQTVRPTVDRDMAKKVLESAWLPDVLEHPDLPPPVPEQAK